jgi:hypothetical protein
MMFKKVSQNKISSYNFYLARDLRLELQAQDEILKIMELDCLPKFLSSKYVRYSIQLLSHPNFISYKSHDVVFGNGFTPFTAPASKRLRGSTRQHVRSFYRLLAKPETISPSDKERQSHRKRVAVSLQQSWSPSPTLTSRLATADKA